MRTPNNERLTPDIAEVPEGRNASGPAGPRHQQGARDRQSERRCILTGEIAPRASLVRLAISPEGLVLPDPGAKAPGRGAWIGVDRAALEEALVRGHLKGALARAFKGAALELPADLPARVEAALRKALLDRLGLELRAGNVVLGAQRIAEQARSGRIVLLLHASDSSEDGRKSLDQAWRVGSGREGTGARGLVLPLDRAALSVALGRSNVVHLGVGGSHSARQAGERVETALMRLLQFTGVAHPTADDRTAPHAQSDDDTLNA